MALFVIKAQRGDGVCTLSSSVAVGLLPELNMPYSDRALSEKVSSRHFHFRFLKKKGLGHS